MIIGLTDPMREGPTLGQYTAWVKANDPDVEVRVLSYVRENADELRSCTALVLSGGNDVHPELYGRMDAWGVTRDVDERRDRFEIGLIDAALKAQMPILGICRGMQVFNVARGGTLIPDLPAAGYEDHSKGLHGDRVHEIRIAPGSLAHSVVGKEQAEVNTSHHQAVDHPGDGLIITARSLDGVAEAAEWQQPEGKSFLLLVQWHPERMPDTSSAVAGKIRDLFFTHLRPTPYHQT